MKAIHIKGAIAKKLNRQTAPSQLKETDRSVTFADLLREYEKTYRERPTAPSVDFDKETAYSTALLNLATAVAYSVINKCIDPSRKKENPSLNSGCSPVMMQLKRDIYTAVQNINAIKYATENATAIVEDKNGNAKTVVLDSSLYEGLTKQLNKTIPDGYDLVQDAIVSILAETEKAVDRGDLDRPFLEEKYTVRRLKKKVYIRKADSVNGYETVETAPITEIYKSVRRAIDNSRAVQTDPKSGYCYIEDFIKDGETDRIDRIFYRSAKYADIGSYAFDFNGRPTHYTADLESFETVERLTEKLKETLTDREYLVLSHKLKGRGNKAIATYTGISENACKGATRRIREKALAIGLHSKR